MPGADNLKKDFEKYNKSFTQDKMQTYLEHVQQEQGLSEALEVLYQWSRGSGYLTDALFEDNVHYTYNDKALGVNFRTQINYARSKYSDKPSAAKANKKLHCAICFENVAAAGKELLRAFSFEISDHRRFFAQLTPFPLYPYHFVVIDHEKRPMILSRQSLIDMTSFVEKAPDYTACSNSDVEWAGASILTHHHYQMFKDLQLPIMEAAWHGDYFERTNVHGYTMCWGFLNFPIATIKLRCRDKKAFVCTAAELIRLWKHQDPNKNTMNLVIHLDETGYWVGYLILRNPDFRTPDSLHHIKTEGIGIIEVAGEGVYPVPSGDAADETLKEIKNDGLEVIKSIISSNNPLPEEDWAAQMTLFSDVLRPLSL